MRRGCVGLAVLVSSCTATTSVAPPDATDGAYTDEEIDTKLAALEAQAALLAGCHDGDAVVRDRDGWRCTSAPPCPPGFVDSSDNGYTVCTRIVEPATADIMVKVGRFWIDRHEMSVCNGEVSTTAAGCSASGRQPVTGITWFDAAVLCANAGKHLCTNAEWQLAAAGTTDPGSSSSDGACKTYGALRMTGLAGQCESRYGAQDMIGNAWEWVADWQQAGHKAQTSDGAVALWPAAYQGDVTENVNGKTMSGGWDGTNWVGAWTAALPAAAMRGGDATTNGDSTRSGVFDYNLANAPSFALWNVGARCCVGGR